MAELQSRGWTVACCEGGALSLLLYCLCFDRLYAIYKGLAIAQGSSDPDAIAAITGSIRAWRFCLSAARRNVANLAKWRCSFMASLRLSEAGLPTLNVPGARPVSTLRLVRHDAANYRLDRSRRQAMGHRQPRAIQNSPAQEVAGAGSGA